MILKELFKAQKEFDERVIQEHHLQGKDTFNKKIVAFLVEIGELANEIRFFKFWSVKPTSPREVILEEYSDCVHFILSIGNDLSVACGNIIQEHDYKNDLSYKGLTEDFIRIINDICNIKRLRDSFVNKDKINSIEVCNCIYIETFERLLMLGYKLGFSWKDIETGYYKKHSINFHRQDTNY
jgi:dimeric dUTPase (all-alpha-NTP-PPase superfamily)